MSETITVSAVVIRDAEGRVLTVRKRGTSAFMFPGGQARAGRVGPTDGGPRGGRGARHRAARG